MSSGASASATPSEVGVAAARSGRKADFAQRPRRLRPAGDRADIAKRSDKSRFAPRAPGYRQQPPQSFASQPDDILKGARDQRVDPRFGFAAVLEIEDLHQRASDRSSAFLFDHVHEKVKLAALGNEDAKTVKIAHIVSSMRGRAPPHCQFRSREPQFIPLRKSDKLDRCKMREPMPETYPDTLLLIDGKWRPGASGKTIPVINPATEEVIGQVAHADIADLDVALAAAHKGFAVWRSVSAFERGKILRRAGELLRERAERIALLMTLEQGKPLTEARIEVMAAADTLDWFGEEARRAYGRIVPARAPNVTNLVLKEPVGPVAAFAPWNFPLNQIVRKLGARSGRSRKRRPRPSRRAFRKSMRTTCV